MKFAAFSVLFVLVLAAPPASAAKACSVAEASSGAGTSCEEARSTDSPEPGVPRLSDKAASEVEGLRVHMRYRMAFGMQARSREKRDAIAAIYETQGVALPDEYRDW